MYVAYDIEQPPGREHPWAEALANPDEKYVDFKADPDQIPTALVDFKPWSHYPAIQTFYALLAWLNGADSIFESNDCGLRPPRRDPEVPEPIRRVLDADPIVMHCRLAILFRDLAWNASEPTVDGLKSSIHDALRERVPNFPAVVKIGDWPHLFTEIDKEGRAVTLLIWAWGDDEASAMANLNTTFVNLHGCLRWISDAIKTR